MLSRVPSSRRTSRLVWLSLGGAVAVALYAACGLTVPGAGPGGADAGPEGAPAGDTGSGAIPNNDPDATPQTVECKGTLCGAACSDTATDPANCGGCGKPCKPGDTCTASACGVLCLGETVACAGACVNTSNDPLHCGGCTTSCTDGGSPLCADGGCVPDCATVGLSLCPAAGAAPPFCADLVNDPKNCGVCGKICGVNQVCKASACVDLCATNVKIGDIFAPDMTGCQGTLGYSNRATLCPAGTHVCSANEWVQRRNGKKPTYSYWTNDNLGWYGQDEYCAAGTGSGFNGCNNPMRVCPSYNDPLNNRCNWRYCGLNSRSPNVYLGGCDDNRTSGTLCCK